ncbi:MAG: Transcriptional regulator, XRE family [uncultured bacterium]|nr:MAG: Transcriptional regulator, XRE family [uncultured bacterium]
MIETFNRRAISNNETLGQKLKRQREQTHLDIADVAEALAIKPDYIEAIERSDYRALPSRVFVKNYVRNYTKFLKLNWVVVEPLLNEELQVYEVQPDIPTLKRHLTKQPLRIIQVVGLVGIIFLIVAVGAYFSFEIGNIIQPPELKLEEVPTAVAADQRFITIAGQTDAEAIVSINDQVIPVQTDGRFSQAMALQAGSNVFKITSQTKRSRPNNQFLQIFVENN